MNKQKICFITCVNDEIVYQKSLVYINNLILPESFDVEIITIKNAAYITKAYNEAMQSSDAKYKVYLHQDIFIINKNFIIDVINTFQKDENIGLIGIVGAEKLPTNACWREAQNRYGTIYDSHKGYMDRDSFNDFEHEVIDVQAIDGILMITQHDIPWREDIFTGWHFYDISQSIEFAKKGYRVVVPKQIEPWCIHDCGVTPTSEKYEEYKNVFLDEYSKDIYPLVSILIPTYNRPEYFKIALESAINQTYRNIEVIVGDDSTNEKTKSLMQSYLKQYKNILYFFHGGPMGGLGEKNACHIFDKCNGEYINWLMDDDIYHLDKIRVMMNYYIENPTVSLVTSYRQPIDANGNYLNDNIATKKIFNNDSFVEGNIMAREILLQGINFIGEPTTALVKKNTIDRAFGMYFGRRYGCMSDVTQWLESLKNGKLVYISKALSYFRIHNGQKQATLYIHLHASVEKFYYITDSYENHYYIKNSDEYKMLLKNWIRTEEIYKLSEKRSLLEKELGYEQEKFQLYIECLNKVKKIINY